MCGICGFFGNSTGIDRVGMLSALSHRGPDGQGEYEDNTSRDTLWFGHRRLAILDLSQAGHQPMSSLDGKLTITFNGEIYNFRETRQELEELGYCFQSHSDTEVILNAWKQWRHACLERLQGMFAFALWDREDRELWLVRDRQGEKPLYYAHQDSRLVFASEVRSILRSGVVRRHMSSDGLDSYLTFGSVADPFTLVEGVSALRAGHYLRYKDGKTHILPYWSMSDIPEPPFSGEIDDARTSVARLLRRSSSLCMISDVPVALLLSGGIDSSSNVALLSEQGYRNLMTYSVVFEGQDEALSEERWSSLVARQFKTSHNRVRIGEGEARQWVPEAVAAMDQPTFDGINSFFVCRAISVAGVKVAVSGQGADELFLGYWQRHLFPLLLKLACVPIKFLNTPVTELTSRIKHLHDSKYEKLLQTIASPDALAAAYLAQHSIFSQKGIERLRGQRRPSQTRFVQAQGGKTPLNMLSRLELTHYLRNTLLRDADQMSMANSLELRAPFIDYKLVERVVSLPSYMKAEPKHRQKPLLVDAVSSKIVEKVANRPKQGFALPFNRWMQNGLGVSDPCEVEMGLDKKAVLAVKDRFCAGQNWFRYWSLQVLATWVSKENLSPPSDHR